MNKYLAIALLLCFASCKSTLSANIDADLNAVGVILTEPYEVSETSKGFSNSAKIRVFALTISNKDMQAIADGIKHSENYSNDTNGKYATSANGTNELMEVAYQYKKGYKLYISESNIFHRSLYIDTIDNKLYFEYRGKLF